MNYCLEKTEIVRTEQLAEDIHRITVVAPAISQAARPGQFVMVRVSGELDPLLRRPFSIHQITAAGHIQILFKVVGKGTRILAGLTGGQALDMVGPLGRGFSISPRQPACLVGGGMGIAPLLFLAKSLLNTPEPAEVLVLLGARTKEELDVPAREMAEMGVEVRIATDDGSMGHHGLVTDLLDQVDPAAAFNVFACGPYPMMKAAAAKAQDKGWPCQVSLETMMACGLAACLGCAMPRKEGAGYMHVCKEGPVFEAGEVLWL